MRVTVQPSFLIFWTILCLLDTQGLMLYFLPAAILHELGHFACLYALGGHAEELELNGAGAKIEMVLNGGYRADILTSASGPLANLLCACLCGCFRWEMSAGAHLILGLFNLLPILPLDGGRIAAALLEASPLGWRAQEYMLRWSQGCSIVLFFVGVYFIMVTNNPALLFVGGYLTLNTCKITMGRLY